jgi:hypothetical protein
VPPAAIVVADTRGRLSVVDTRGRTLRTVPGAFGEVQAVTVAPDRTHAYLSQYVADKPSRLSLVDLRTGRRRFVALGLSPTVSPDGSRLAYLSTTMERDIKQVSALVVRDLRTHGVRTFAFPHRTPVGTPPELIVNWAPDSRRVTVYDGRAARLVDTAVVRPVSAEPAVAASGLAAVFADARTVVVDANCCIGRQRLVSAATRATFATLSSPPETAVRTAAGTLVITTALKELVVVTRGHVRVVRRGVTAAGG